MTESEILNSPDQYVWAEEFCKIAKRIGFDPENPEDVAWVAGWIANAMMHGVDRGRKIGRRESYVAGHFDGEAVARDEAAAISRGSEGTYG